MAQPEHEQSPLLPSPSAHSLETGESQHPNTESESTLRAASQSHNANDSRVSTKARDLTSRALEFLSTANSETLGACAVGLCAVTYFVLGRVGLLLIGLTAGVVIHAAWEGREHGVVDETFRTEEGRKRREKGLDIVHRLLDLRLSPSSTGDEENKADANKQLDYTDLPVETGKSLEGLTGAIIRDYVKWWYQPILPEENSFPSACRHTLTAFFLSISNRLSHKRPSDVFLDFLTNSSSIVIVFLNELSAAISASRSTDSQQVIEEYLEENPSCSLGNVLSGEQQKRKLQAVADDVVQTFVEVKAYACEPVRIFLTEVLAGLVLDMTIASCSRADFLNEWIIWGLEESDTTELVEALDAGVSHATDSNAVMKAAASMNGTTINGDASSAASPSQAQTKAAHRRTVSKAEAAMEEAMREAQKMNEMIAEEEAKQKRDSTQLPNGTAVPSETNGVVPDVAVEDGEDAPHGHGQQSHKDERQGSQEADPPPTDFKSFDQIISSQKPTALRSDTSPLPSPPLIPPQLTLHKARISIFDDSVPGEKGNIKSKPTAEYLLQVEPATSSFPGWMIARKYTDFEKLHEVLRRISVISGVVQFTQRHVALPGWKGNTKSGLRVELEKYLQDALSYQRLAESEGMKRFLDKDQHLPQGTATKNNFGFPKTAAFENVGKGVLDVLSNAPKGAATGGKAIVGGMTGVFGGVASLGQKKAKSPAAKSPAPSSNSPYHKPQGDSISRNSLQRHSPSQDSISRISVASQESLQSSQYLPAPPELPAATPRQSEDISTLRRAPSTASNNSDETPEDETPEQHASRISAQEQAEFHLPPPPSEISDDYRTSPRPSVDDSTLHSSISTAPTSQSPPQNSNLSVIQPDQPDQSTTTKATRAPPTPLTIQETTVAVELFFATINELYTLSTAWTLKALRLTLLNTAKSFLLRPGNANLEAIRQLLQSTIIDANTSDAGIATHITKIRENALPTDEELKKWPPPLTKEESEKRREKARKLLVEKGMPQALTSVMGQAASGEALGKVFDCLQVPDVARGLVFAITLQAMRALTQ